MAWNSRTDEEVKTIIGGFGYKLLNIYFSKRHEYLKRAIVQDELGYKYDVDLSYFISRNGETNIVGNTNPYSLENISLWLRINNKLFVLCENQEYKGSISKLSFYCFKCQEIFKCSWISVYSINQGCSFCVGQQVGKYNNLEYLYPELANEWNVNNKKKPYEVVCGSHEKVFWVCTKCNHNWESSISNRVRGSGCPYCSGRAVSDKNRLSILYPEISKEWHPTKNGELTPNDVSYGSDKNVWWICIECYHEWKSSINNRTNNKTGCLKCNLSKGELRISKVLYENRIEHISQFRFDNCRNVNPLPFDFYLPEYNLCIEYHGEQHYEAKEFFGGKNGFKLRKKLDKIKLDYCKNNNIRLLIIPYWDFDNIEEILEKALL